MQVRELNKPIVSTMPRGGHVPDAPEAKWRRTGFASSTASRCNIGTHKTNVPVTQRNARLSFKLDLL